MALSFLMILIGIWVPSGCPLLSLEDCVCRPARVLQELEHTSLCLFSPFMNNSCPPPQKPSCPLYNSFASDSATPVCIVLLLLYTCEG